MGELLLLLAELKLSPLFGSADPSNAMSAPGCNSAGQVKLSPDLEMLSLIPDEMRDECTRAVGLI